MNPLSAYLYGTRIIENQLATTVVPVRVHVATDSMKKSYHQRIQKKWNKRFGFAVKPAVYKTAFGLVCHPEIAATLRKELKSPFNIQS